MLQIPVRYSTGISFTTACVAQRMLLADMNILVPMLKTLCHVLCCAVLCCAVRSKSWSLCCVDQSKRHLHGRQCLILCRCCLLQPCLSASPVPQLLLPVR